MYRLPSIFSFTSDEQIFVNRKQVIVKSVKYFAAGQNHFAVLRFSEQ